MGDLWDFLLVKKGHIKRGFAGGKTLKGIDSINLEGLREHHGLRAAGSWETLNIPETSKDYIRTILKNGDDLMKPARIKLSTIHSVKGEECDNVVLFTDLERIIYESSQNDADAEHRTFFVGITRAKENLFVCSQYYEYQYNIGATSGAGGYYAAEGGYITRASMNMHNWVGLVTNYEKKINLNKPWIFKND